MALQKQVVPISLGQGVDTKTDPKQVIVGKLLSLFNATFQKGKKFLKRFGTVSLSQNVIGGGTISTGMGLSTYNQELCLLNGTNIYSYSESESAWASRGYLQPVGLSTKSINQKTTTQSYQDSAYHAGTNLSIYVWIDSTYGLCYSIFDQQTGAAIVNSSTGINANATKCKVLTVGQYFVIFYYNTFDNALEFYSINTATPTTLGPDVILANDINTTNRVYDVTLINGSIYVAYGKGVTSIAFYKISSSLVVSPQFVVVPGRLINAISIATDSSFNVWCSYAVSGGPGELYLLVVNAALSSTVLAETAVDNVNVNAMTLIVSGTTASIYYEAVGTASHYLKSCTVTLAGTVGSPSVVLRGVGLASKVFLSDTSVRYMFVIYAGQFVTNSLSVSTLTSLEPTYFMITQFGQVALRLSGQNAAAGYVSGGILSEVVSFGGSVFGFPYLVQTDVSTQNGSLFYKTGISAAFVDFAITQAPTKFALAKELHVGGGELWMYDGSNVVEHGFHLFPENLASGTFTGSGGIGRGTSTSSTNQVQYVSVYEWMDNQGQIHQSAPSSPLTVQISGTSGGVPVPVTFTATSVKGYNVLTAVSSFTGVVVGQVYADATSTTNLPTGTYITAIDQANSRVTLSQPATVSIAGDTYSTGDILRIPITIPTLRVTAKQNVSIALYRTTNNGSVFYRTSSLTSLTYNDTTADSVTINDSTPDAVLVGNQPLYTNGGEVQNYPVPPTQITTLFKNRAIAVPAENPNSFWYSKQVIPGSPVEFSADFVQNVDSRGGDIKAIGVLDEKLVLFKDSCIFCVVGSGPAPDGSSNDFSEAQLIASDTGCSNQNSLAITGDGLMFQSAKGIYLLDRSLAITYIGAEVEDFSTFDVSSTVVTPTYNQSRFALSGSSQVLVFDTYFRQWSIFTGITAVDCAILDDLVLYLTAAGKVLKESTSLYTDDGAFVQMSLLTGWLNFAGIQGFQRVRRLEILGDYKSPHSLLVNFSSDFSSSQNQNVTIPVTTSPGVYQYRIPLTVQKCESLQIEIKDSQSSAFGEGLSLSALTLEVAIKSGANKLSQGQTYG